MYSLASQGLIQQISCYRWEEISDIKHSKFHLIYSFQRIKLFNSDHRVFLLADFGSFKKLPVYIIKDCRAYSFKLILCWVGEAYFRVI